jgi:4-amino-4-deoxy-L-arabinose transferase-like glycosyltransferase
MQPNTLAFASWRTTLLIISAWLVLRVAYLRWLCPYELSGDEANYWECGRRLALSYHYSGPGVAAIYAAMERLLGAHEWSLRLPAAVSMALTALIVARLGASLSRGDERVGFFSALIVLLFPYVMLWSQIMTYDPPTIACWALATWIAWEIVQVMRRRAAAPDPLRAPYALWAALGLVMGIGFLLKYSMVLLAPGLAAYAWVRRRELGWRRRDLAAVMLSITIFVVAISPVLVWNQQRGWPTIVYLRGHLNAPVDIPHKPYNPLWPLDFLGAQLLCLGPFAPILFGLAIAGAVRQRRVRPEDWKGESLVIYTSSFLGLFFLANTLHARSQGNWATAAYAPLAVLLGQQAVGALPGAWARGRRSLTVLWGLFVLFSGFAFVCVSYPQFMAALPVVGKYVPLERLRGGRRLAAQMDDLVAEIRAQTGREPFIVAKTYADASQLAFYMQGHPTTYCAASRLGWRRNTYDFWKDTDLTAPALRGRPVVMVGGLAGKWQAAFKLRSFRTLSIRPPIYLGEDYQGPTK